MGFEPCIEMNGRKIGPGQPTYIVAEISANHRGSLEEARNLIRLAKESGADAVKLQTYTPDTLTIDCNNQYFRIGGESLWSGRTLYDLYQEAYTHWEWHIELMDAAKRLGLDIFSTAFDPTSVDFLEEMNVPVHKVASFEIVDIPLIEKMAGTGKPLIISTGMATLGEIEEAVLAARTAGAEEIALLKCTSAYPAPPEGMNLRTMPHLSQAFDVPVGLSDHTLGIEVPVAAVSLGACMVEKHFTHSRSVPGPDSPFSLEPQEFKAMVEAIRVAEKALGNVSYGPGPEEAGSLVFRRSLFVVEDISKGAAFTPQNLRSIRPGNGLHPRHQKVVLSCRATRDITKGTPLSWDLVDF